MARRAQIPGASDQVADNVRKAIDHLVGECLNASSLGAPTESVSAIASALEAMAARGDGKALHEMGKVARAYLRKNGLPTIAPERSEVVRGMVQDAESAIAKAENADMTTRTLGIWMTHWGLRAFGPPPVYETAKRAGKLSERYEEWSWAPQHVFRRVFPHITKAMDTGADAEKLVIATLVGYGFARKRAAEFVNSAFRNDARSPKARRV